MEGIKYYINNKFRSGYYKQQSIIVQDYEIYGTSKEVDCIKVAI